MIHRAGGGDVDAQNRIRALLHAIPFRRVESDRLRLCHAPWMNCHATDGLGVFREFRSPCHWGGHSIRICELSVGSELGARLAEEDQVPGFLVPIGGKRLVERLELELKASKFEELSSEVSSEPIQL